MKCGVEKISNGAETCPNALMTADEIREGKDPATGEPLCYMHMPGSAWWQANRGSMGIPGLQPNMPGFSLGNAGAIAAPAASPTGYRCAECDAIDNASHHPGCPMAQGARAPGPPPGFHVNGQPLSSVNAGTGAPALSLATSGSGGLAPSEPVNGPVTAEYLISVMKRLPNSEYPRFMRMMFQIMEGEADSLAPRHPSTAPAPINAMYTSPDGMSRTIIGPPNRSGAYPNVPGVYSCECGAKDNASHRPGCRFTGTGPAPTPTAPPAPTREPIIPPFNGNDNDGNPTG